MKKTIFTINEINQNNIIKYQIEIPKDIKDNQINKIFEVLDGFLRIGEEEGKQQFEELSIKKEA